MNRSIPTPILVFDFADEHNKQQRQVFLNPVQVISVNDIEDVCPALEQIEQAIHNGYYAAGYISYEASPAFDSALTVCPNPTLPLLWFGIFSEPTHDLNYPWDERFRLSDWQPMMTRDEYGRNIRSIRDAISRGETYQVNYTTRFQSVFDGDDLGYYHFLKNRQQAGYSAYLNIGDYRILSSSPELFFCLDGEHIVTRPMKGTAKRGKWFEEDEENASRLRSSEKNQAENLMIVDLLRNDVGRISETGSVNVPQLFDIERYPTVFQMTSTVTATVRANTTLTDIFRALFPCGSVTGAPKVSTMRLISQLEGHPRETYCGSIGFLKPNGNAVFNVAIRTLVIDTETGVAEYGAGGGITWDSMEEEEYAEMLTKAAFLGLECPPFKLLETLKLDDGEYVLLDGHLERLLKSAQYFGICVQESELVSALRAHADLNEGERRRVRLLVSPLGQIQVESSALEEYPNASLPVALGRTPISKCNRFLYHKTTHRSVYEIQRSRHENVFDVLLWNENEEITEFTNGNVVLELDGMKWTPTLETGLLPGTFRAQLLADKVIREKVLTVKDLRRAKHIWFINSVRGWVPVHFLESRRE